MGSANSGGFPSEGSSPSSPQSKQFEFEDFQSGGGGGDGEKLCPSCVYSEYFQDVALRIIVGYIPETWLKDDTRAKLSY